MSRSGRPMADVSGPHAGQPMLTAGAPAAAAGAGLVALHGRGATAQGIVNLLQPAVRHGVAVFAPQASRSRWFPRPFDAPVDENEPDLSSGVDCVGAALDRAEAIGLSPDRVVVAGFSQGACVAAEFAVRHPTRYGGVAVLSGALPGPPDRSRALSGSLDGTPVFIGCGADDPHVDSVQIDATAQAFEALDADVTTRRYPDLGHAVTDDEFEALGAVLEGIKNRDGEDG